VNVAEDCIEEYFNGVDAVIHLAALVGFPACQAAGDETAYKYNVEGVQQVFETAERTGVRRFIFSSTYSNYGLSPDGEPVTEESPLNPQSLYAETKIAAENYLLEKSKDSPCSPLIYRFATLFGISPRTRFDLIVNQFVLEALTKGELIIYQRDYTRAFVHVSDIVEALVMGLTASEGKIRGEIYNVGSDKANFSKDEVVRMIQKHIPETAVTYKDLSFGGDMRDICVSFAKIKKVLDFQPAVTLVRGVKEVRDAIKMGIIANPMDPKYRNARLIVQ
jgi:nucleoside-diphosphate-sugar epimerase